MVDIKGQAVIGSMTGGTYGLGLGGIYGEVVAGGGEEGGAISWIDDPHLTNLTISRDGNNAIIRWTKVPSDYAGNYYLFWLERRDFENASTNWMGPQTITGGGNSFSDANQIGMGNDRVFYRVISANDKAQLINRPSVGKVNVSVTLGWNLVGVPFVPSLVNDAIGTNFATGDQIWAWRSGDFIAPIQYNSTSSTWASGMAMISGEGFGLNIVNTDPGTVKTVIGKVSGDIVSKSIDIGWNLIADPFAKSLSGDFGLNAAAGAAVGDQIWEWRAGDFIAPIQYNGTAWPASQLNPGKGYGYNHIGAGVNWRIGPSSIY